MVISVKSSAVYIPLPNRQRRLRQGLEGNNEKKQRAIRNERDVKSPYNLKA